MTTKRLQLLVLVAHPYQATKDALAGAITQWLHDYDIVTIVVGKAASAYYAVEVARTMRDEAQDVPAAVAIMPYTYAQETVDGELVRTHLERIGFTFVLLGGVPPMGRNEFHDLPVCDASDADGIVAHIVRAVPEARVMH